MNRKQSIKKSINKEWFGEDKEEVQVEENQSFSSISDSMKKILFFIECKNLSEKRGMKISKAAVRLGADSITAKAVSIASSVLFHDTEAAMIAAAKNIAHSCMSNQSESYAYWAATTYKGIRVLCVATYKNTRALVRWDNRSFIKAYGEQHAELLSALESLGYVFNPEAFYNGLEFPKLIYSKEAALYTLKKIPIPYMDHKQ